jgi:hypothetical protein
MTTRPASRIELDGDRLAALVDNKLRLLERLVEFARKQRELIGQDDLDSLMALLSTKQRLVEGLQQVERALDPFRDQPAHERLWRSSADRANCRRSAERCEHLVKELLEHEQQAAAELTRRREQTETRLQGFDSASRVHSAYFQSAPPARRLDLSSS